MTLRLLAGAIAAALLANALPALAQEPPTLRVAGNFSANRKHVDNIERPFFDALARNAGLKAAVNYNPLDVLGLQAADGLRHLRSGAFDVMSVQVGMVARDDPFFEGLDLIGVAPDMRELRKVVDAYRGAFDQRLQTRFNTKALTIWPFGPQVIYCNTPIRSVDDLKGQKIRTFTPSMSALMQSFGATPVTLQFSEVYPSLQRGVANCAVTSPTSGNTGKWPEVTSHFLPLALAGAIQGHFMNLDTWRKYSADQQARIQAEFKKMEDLMWSLAITANEDATNCNVGREPCKEHTKYRMTLVEVTPAEVQKVRAAVSRVVLPMYKSSCSAIDPKCVDVWNQTVGQVTGLKID